MKCEIIQKTPYRVELVCENFASFSFDTMRLRMNNTELIFLMQTIDRLLCCIVLSKTFSRIFHNDMECQYNWETDTWGFNSPYMNCWLYKKEIILIIETIKKWVKDIR